MTTPLAPTPRVEASKGLLKLLYIIYIYIYVCVCVFDIYIGFGEVLSLGFRGLGDASAGL